ncbi:SDR family NAD(P)-dependent oxidoreductase [Microbacterium sp.]|uniref:SDR family NAD(P)-dependent oxidoreductase n=1 Tax=Microbacterium sp. TaxID=51671 RepID=UPI003A8D121F
MDLELNGRVILVVGGTGLLGSAVVQRLSAEGATAVGASRHHGLVMDARDDESVTAGIAQVLAEHGRIDGLVVAAAPSARTLDPARNSDPAQALEAFDAKAMAFLRVARAVMPAMTDAGYGRIVGISGQNAFQTGNVTGSVRNAALVIVGKNLADAAAGTGVTVNVVNPGIVADEPSTEIPMGRSGECSPAQVADLVALLLSPRTATISGESIAVGHRVRGATGL